MSNIFLYAVDRSNLRFKGETYVLTPDPNVKTTRTIKLARIRYAGNWHPEPGGWRRLEAYLLNERKLGLQVDTVSLGAAGDGTTAAPSHAKDAAKADRRTATPRAAAPAKSTPFSPAPEGKTLKGYDVAHLT